MESEKILFVWSGGKDSAMAIYELLSGANHHVSPQYEIVALLTTITRDYDRISMHGVRRQLLEEQAESIGIPLEKVFISKNAKNEEYEKAMSAVLEGFRRKGITRVAFGDIFLEDLRKYREENLRRINMEGIFPIWKRDTKKLAVEFINRGFRAIVVCVDTKKLPAEFSGKEFDFEFLNNLPDGVDPCGENGEFHTFVYAGPIFKRSIGIRKGVQVMRYNRYCFTDILPGVK